MSLVFRSVSVCLLGLAALVFPAAAEMTVGPASGAPGLPDTLKSALAPEGFAVKDGGAGFVQVWLNKSIPTEKSSEAPRGSDFTNLPVGAFIGVIQYSKDGGDFRGQSIKAGVYTMRFALQPEDGNHQGASPRRDHLVLSRAADDQDPNAKPNFDAMVDMSKKASGTNHPLVLFLTLPQSSAKFPGVDSSGGKQVLNVKSGSVELGITIVGKAEE
jgi:hypothetical protein